MNRTRLCLLLSVLLGVFPALFGQEVHPYAGSDSSLAGRWQWAWQEGSRNTSDKEFWIGYSIKRLMNEDSYLLSGNVISGRMSTRNALYDVLRIARPEGAKKNSDGRTDGEPSVFKRMKDVAILFLCSGSSSGERTIERVELCAMELSLDLKKHPVFWIGSTDDNQSVQLLKSAYKAASLTDVKKHVVEAVGIHQQSDESYPYLSEILKGTEPDEVRGTAAFWLGEQRNPAGLKLLMDVAQNDRSTKVREQAVFAISRIDDDSSIDALITLVRNGRDSKVRSRAAFWLGQKASQKAVSTLEDVIANDGDSDVQRQALYGLWQTKDQQAIERVIKIAQTHPNPRIRKQAIQILGQSDDPKALEALIEIARK